MRGVAPTSEATPRFFLSSLTSHFSLLASYALAPAPALSTRSSPVIVTEMAPKACSTGWNQRQAARYPSAAARCNPAKSGSLHPLCGLGCFQPLAGSYVNAVPAHDAPHLGACALLDDHLVQ